MMSDTLEDASTPTEKSHAIVRTLSPSERGLVLRYKLEEQGRTPEEAMREAYQIVFGKQPNAISRP